MWLVLRVRFLVGGLNGLGSSTPYTRFLNTFNDFAYCLSVFDAGNFVDLMFFDDMNQLYKAPYN